MMMSDLNLEATQSSPAIKSNWDAGTLVMRGDSYPENSFDFFAPVIHWLQSYISDAEQPLTLELHLLYLNTSSVKVMMDVFDLLEEAYSGGRQVSVKWFYDRENDRIAELAEEFKEDCSFPFDIVEAPH